MKNSFRAGLLILGIAVSALACDPPKTKATNTTKLIQAKQQLIPHKRISIQ